MDGVKTAGTHQFHSLVEREMLLLDVVAQTLQVSQCGMALVAVVDVFLDAKLLQGQYATDTEQDFLLQTVLPVAAIEAVGDGLVVVAVHLVVGVEQIELDAAHIDTPYVRVYHIISIGHVNHHRLSVLVELALNGQMGEILCLILGNLLSVHRQALREIAEAIEEAHGHHVDITVRSFLQVVASQHAETTAIDFQSGVHTILHREVGHTGTFLIGFHIHVGTEQLVDGLYALHQSLVFHDFLLAFEAQTL